MGPQILNPVAIINGDAYDWEGTTVKVWGATLHGITDMQYDKQRETQNNHGRGSKAVSISYGKEIIPPGSMTIEESEYRKMVQAAGGDITKAPPTPVVVFKKRGLKGTTDKLLYVRFTGQAQSLNVDTMRNMVQIPFQAGDILYGQEI